MLDTWYIDATWITVAFIGGLLARKINLPPLVGFLVAGFALNFAGFNSGGVALEAVSNLGVMLLLFTIGLKLNFRSLLAPEIWLATSIQMTLMSIVFGLIIFGLGFSGLYFLADIELTTSLIIGFALSFSSTVFAIKILEDRGEVNSFHGKLTIGILVMQDIAAVIYLSLTGQGDLSLWLIALPFYLFIVRFILLKLISNIDHGELLTLFGFFAAFVAGAISFKLFGLKADLGALIIGAMLAPHERSKELSKHMMGYKDFFLVAFFLQIGLSGFPTGMDVLFALVLTLLLNFKGAFFMVLFTRFNLRARSSWLASLSLTNYSEFGLIVVSISAAEGMISEQWMTILALALSISFLINSPLNIKAHQLFNRYRPQIALLNKNCVHPDDELMSLGNTEYLICGMGRIGSVVYEHLYEIYGDKVMGIDYDTELVEKLQAKDKNVFWGDATDSTFWENAKRSKVKMVFIAMSDHKSNVNVAREIASLTDRKFVAGATSKFKDETIELKKAGTDFVYNYYDRLGEDFAERFVRTKDNLKVGVSNKADEA
jgi:predicted Kef-type K+ transport protein